MLQDMTGHALGSRLGLRLQGPLAWGGDMPERLQANPVHKQHIQSHPTSHLILRRP